MDVQIQLINQFFEIEQKIAKDPIATKLERNLNRLHHIWESEGYKIVNPIGEKYNDTRTDCEASIVGHEGKNMMITQVVKPIVYSTINGKLTLLQKGIVIAENK